VLLSDTFSEASAEQIVQDIMRDIRGVISRLVNPPEVCFFICSMLLACKCGILRFQVQRAIDELIQQGILLAASRMSQQTANSSFSYRPDNLVRKIPVVGRVWGWISPWDAPAIADSAVGQSFDMRSRALKSVSTKELMPLPTHADAKLRQKTEFSNVTASIATNEAIAVKNQLSTEPFASVHQNDDSKLSSLSTSSSSLEISSTSGPTITEPQGTSSNL
jgi:hypothetical protein